MRATPYAERAPLRVDRAALDETLETLRSRLLRARTVGGWWEGHLASSALATATAVSALALANREGHTREVRAGVAWLVAHQNEDGGWGDTTRSRSNISTTALVWAACALAGDARAASTSPRESSSTSLEAWVGINCDTPGDALEDADLARAMSRAEAWLRGVAGSLEPDALVSAIARRYGKDRTFSVPILTVLAIAGKLGAGKDAWRRVPQLPFELAACPHQWFQWLRLPVVSYALPALIAIGQVRHHHRPTRNPLTRIARAATRARTLDTLRAIQPATGGFLEATPLTAFVTISLVAAGHRDHKVVEQGVRFLLESRRDDGSWPIDTNLATWVTTLSINALSIDDCPALDRHALLAWLMGQQHRVEHPYTHAAPGGWAWTDLSGGVPDADDTPGALLAVARLMASAMTASDAPNDAVRERAILGVQWLLDLQNRDGGIPTFCRGWGALAFDRSSPDLTAHTLLAWDTWRSALPVPMQARVSHATDRAVAFLDRVQRADGAWVPLWFGNERAPEEENPTYGTARVLIALAKINRRELAVRGIGWLLTAQNDDGGWGGAIGVPSSIEETALAVDALAANALAGTMPVQIALARGAEWLIDATDRGARTPASPIGLYFAKLWYDEALYPLIFAVSALGRARRALGAYGMFV
jgi:squalene-hopene/tetraprenyl-beta-curcumene cyclase